MHSKIFNSQADWEGRLRVGEREDTVGFIGLLDYGVDVADFGNRFQNLLVLVLIEAALFLGLQDHLVVLLYQRPTQPRLLILPHPLRLLFTAKR